ncbi:hypothetical protein [Nannocystis punicea]|uniref:DUF3558 domain-containing protein n=1 Tax=Nannocystis punicea TaxID=2995304 RepID=A0ABY7GUT6_9BACT|nr:hypothetical protein [Nannocystis poenicansa]WAS90707.1 hypothetical protein O0S08_31355 [Nannocystis poenicansa]
MFASLFVAVAACTPKEGSDSATDTDPATETAATEGDPSGATHDDPTVAPATEPEATGSEPEPTETETDGEVTAATDDTAGTDDTGPDPDLPEECVAPADPAVSAAFSIEGPGWLPTENFANFKADLTCTVASVAVDAGTVTTELACELDGAPQTATFKIAAAPEGEVDWAADDEVKLYVGQSEEFSVFQAVRLQRLDDSILAVAVRGGFDNGLGSVFEPLGHSIVPACGEALDVITPAAIEIAIPEGPSVVIFSGHRGALPIDEEHAFAIDAARVEVGYCCHHSDEQEVALRRVRLGG